MGIRIATVNDAKALLDIYKYYVENTAITFEIEDPTIEEFQNRIITTLEKYPYIIYEENGEILGYAYASAFHERAAYRFSAETSIYVKHDMLKSGIGKKLYLALEDIVKKQNITNLYACIAYPYEKKDPYVTDNSESYHAHMGYRLVGEFKQCSYKFGRWYDMVFMEKILQDHSSDQKEFIPFPMLVNTLK